MKNRQWNPRSQKSLLEELRLKRELANSISLAANCEAKSASLREERDRQITRAVAGRGGAGERGLAENLRAIEDNERAAVAYREHAKALQAQIDALSPPPGSPQVVERAERQAFLASLAADRLEDDRKIEGAVGNLRALLQARRELTARLAELARALGLERFDLDSERFETLLACLPPDLASASESWLGWLVGEKRKGTKPYRVCREDFTLPESLASAHLYQPGDRVDLTPEEAAKALGHEPGQGRVYRGDAGRGSVDDSPPIVPVEPEPAVKKPDEVGLARLKGEPSRPLSSQEVADFVRR